LIYVFNLLYIKLAMKRTATKNELANERKKRYRGSSLLRRKEQERDTIARSTVRVDTRAPHGPGPGSGPAFLGAVLYRLRPLVLRPRLLGPGSGPGSGPGPGPKHKGPAPFQILIFLVSEVKFKRKPVRHIPYT
jgi:hypothetical protein